MPYYFDAHEAPQKHSTDLDAFWGIWETVKHDLLNVVFESEEEALNEKYRGPKDESGERYLNWSLVRFRQTDDRDQLLYFHGLGLDALGFTEIALREERLDANFAYHWGMLLACHGYVLCASLAQGSDLANKRAGRASREATSLEKHERWFAHYFLRERRNTNNREETLERIERLIHKITDGSVNEIEERQLEWFDRFLSLDEELSFDTSGGQKTNPRYGKLTKRFAKELTEKRMKELVELPTDGLPSLSLKIPPT